MKDNKLNTSEITLPKGGGAIRSIGDTFKPNSFTGTGSYSIPISVPKSRDFTPALSINYNSGNGNGIFGLGFSLSLPKVTRRTSLGIPKYKGNDVFLLNGSELVLKNNSSAEVNDYLVNEYLLRTEGSFSTIKQLVKKDGSDSYWEVTNTKNETLILGRTNASRIFNPKNEQQIFEWLVCEASNSKGSKQKYTYKKEDKEGLQSAIWSNGHSYNNCYISCIQYGNYTLKGVETYAFEVVFDYGEYNLDNLNQKGVNPHTAYKVWPERSDSFSSFLSGFEIRTCRRCSNVLIFHHFQNELGDPYLVKRLAFKYNTDHKYQFQQVEIPSSISEIVFSGYRRKGITATDPYDIQVMPAINFGFSKLLNPINPVFKPLQINGKPIPGSLSRNDFFPVDLNQEGISGLLYENSSLAYFEPKGKGNYGFPQTPKRFPIANSKNNQNTSFVDLEGDGTLSLVVKRTNQTGFFKGINSENWNLFRPFKRYPTDLNLPQPERAGLSHNGKTDLLVVNETDLLVYESLGEEGYAAAIKRQKPIDFPSIKKGERKEYCGFVDLLGDGLPHRVKISPGIVECWPDMGYGNFGEKIIFGNAPKFDSEFDIHRLFFADIDGSGTQDIVYAHSDYVEVFFNQNGNSFANSIEIQLPEPFSDNDKIQFTDVLGNGTTCLVFSKMDQSPRHYFFNFNGEVEIHDSLEKSMKPHLLNFIDNNLGATTQIQYSSSINFYLEDKEKGRPWITKLPFPVQVVEQVVVTDQVSKSRYSHRFKYHDGFYDRTERTFRGFGFVESWDSETYDNFDKGATKQNLATIQDENFVPPKYTKSWFHTGVSFNDRSILDTYRKDFYQGDEEAYHFPDINLDIPSDQENSETIRQAFVALQGKLIREEVYAEDKTQHPDLFEIPYYVNESNNSVRLFQSLGENPYSVFLVLPRESISYHYERNPKDPRIQQNFVLELDDFGNSIKACTIFLPRRTGNEDNYPQQETLKAELNWSSWVSPPVESLYCHQSCAQQGFEVTGLQLTGANYFSFDILDNQLQAINVEKKINVIPYSSAPTAGVQARQLSWQRIYFWNQALDAAAEIGVISELGLYHHKEDVAFDMQFPIEAFNGRIIDNQTYKNQGYLSNIIYTEGGYFYDETNQYWWNKGIIQSYYDASKYYLSSIAENSFSKETEGTNNPQNNSLYSKVEVLYDSYALHKTDLIHYLDANKQTSVEAEIDYVTLKAYQVSDINNNIHQALFDPLGQVIVTSLFGTENGLDAGGMRLYDNAGIPAEYKPVANPTFEDIVDSTKQSTYLQGATSYFFYDLHTWKNNKQPVCSVKLNCFGYWHSKGPSGNPYCETSIEYSDGLGRVAELKKKTPGGISFLHNKNGGLILQSGIPKEQKVPSRWQTSGRKVYNNKGKVYKEYLPYFMDSPLFYGGDKIPGPPPKVTIYDPLDRQIRINLPKGFFQKIEFTPWEQRHFDENDTILDSIYYKNTYPTASANEKAAIDKTIHCYNTPSLKVLDNLGYVILQSENNLGNVSPETFKSISTAGISQTDIYNALIQADYLVKDSKKPQLTWLTKKYTPYRQGFSLGLPSTFAPLLVAINDILRQNGLWTLLERDIQGRLVKSIDPRLYYFNVVQKKDYYNFKNQYSMGSKKPNVIDSKDAGIHRKLNTIYNQPFWEWTARDYCQITGYDSFQRKLTLSSKEITSSGLVTDYGNFKLLESFTYGESLSKNVLTNLKGHVYSVKDQSGILTNSSYSMLGEALDTSKQLAIEYKSELDWTTSVKLESKSYNTSFEFNALKLQTAETTDDKTIATKQYDEAGKLVIVNLTFSDGKKQSVIESIEYDANDQKQLVKYGNGIITKYAYEASTLRLNNLVSTRMESAGIVNTVQQLEYTYDPMGNIMRKKDGTYDDVFYDNAKVSPAFLYEYDALYRLKTANGRQHIGIDANSYQNSASDSFMQSIFGPNPSANDDTKIENYVAEFSYDESGNLTNKSRTSQSKKVVTRNLAVDGDSNRLSAFQYDDGGNMLTLNLGNSVALGFDSFDNLAKVGVIERSGQDDDADYFTYDSNSLRNRKISERWAHGASVSRIDESIYIGNYELINQYQGKSIDPSNRVFQRQSLRVMDDKDCVVIINYVSEDKSNPSNEKKRTFRFQLDNHLGSVTLEMSEKAKLISYEEYFAYGGTAIVSGTNATEVKLKTYRYSGKERDNSTGLYYYGHRYYAPWLGRWIKADPSGTVDGLNVFAFVGGNPTTRTDSNGFNWTVVFASGTYKILGTRPGISGVPTGRAAGEMALSFSRTSTGAYNPLLTNPQAAAFISADDGKRKSAGVALCHILSANYIANMMEHILNNSSSASVAIASLQKMHEAATGLTSSGLSGASTYPSDTDLSTLLNGMARHIHNLPIGHSRTNSSIQEHDDFEVVASATHGLMFSPRAMQALNFRLEMKDKYSGFDHASYNPRTETFGGKTYIKTSTGLLSDGSHYYVGAHDLYSTHRQAFEELTTTTSPPVYTFSSTAAASFDYVSTATTHPTYTASSSFSYTGQFTSRVSGGTIPKGGTQGSVL